jgi:hypothetical protein
MNNTLHLILLIIIIAVVISQVLRIQKPMILGIILGLLGVIVYYKYNKYPESELTINNQYYNLNMSDICKEACIKDSDKKNNNKDKNKKEEIKRNSPIYMNDGLYDSFSTNLTFDQQKYKNMDIPDGLLDTFEGLKTSDNKYDIDNQIINGNTINPQTPYNDEFWKLQQVNKQYGDDLYTAANLHFSRKPKEAFLFQSRWSADSLRPWIKQELDDNANKIWWEDNQDLDQYM